MTAYRSALAAGRDGFGQLLRAEWTKFRSVRGWVIGLLVAALLIVGLGVLTAGGSHCSDKGEPCPAAPVGPGGEAVDDDFYFVHQPLTGNGGITVRLASLTGQYSTGGVPAGHGQGAFGNARHGVQPWAKAGVMVKAGTGQGSAYAAMMLTGRHGVRMQDDFTHDVAGAAASAGSPRWLRLTRSGDTLTGDESADGTHWTRVGTAHLAGLPATVQIGMFAASPPRLTTSRHLGGARGTLGPADTTAGFDHVSRRGPWRAGNVGNTEDPFAASLGRFRRSGGDFTVTGAGDIAPRLDGQTFADTLIGAFGGLIALVVVGAMFMTAEYRRRLIRTTLAASPRRARVLAAKVLVVGATAFVAALAAILVVVPIGERILRGNGVPLLPVPSVTSVRLVVGTAAVLAVGAVLALALGALLRRSAGAITAVIAAIVLPLILATVNALPVDASQWLLRVTPAAAFAVQQGLPRYAQVIGDYTPGNGYFPLPPWAGFAVLCGYTALALAVAAVVLRRRDA